MRRWTAALAATIGLVILGASPASARPVGTIDPAARTAAQAAIAARLADLNARVTLVDQSPALSAGDRGSLLSILHAAVSGLTSLDSTIANETSQAAFRTEALEILGTYRVYALVLPQVHLVRASDELTSVVAPALQKVEQALQARIAAAPGQTASAATATMADLARQIAAIQTDTSGVTGTLLALTPPQWNADHGVLSGPRQRLGSARTAAVQALDDVRAAWGAIQ